MSLKLGEPFCNNPLGIFFYDEETGEVTVRVEYKGEVFHEHRAKATTLIGQYADAIKSIQYMIAREMAPKEDE